MSARTKFSRGWLLCVPLLAACESERTIDTPKGRSTVECVGINGDKQHGVEYEASTRNVILGVVFFEMIVPPVLVLLKETHCPVGVKVTP